MLRGLRTLLLLLLFQPPGAASAEALRVAVAANFRATAEAMADMYRASGAGEIVISSASTGVLAAQLRAGAPFDLLLAADAERPLALHRDGLAAEEPVCYAVGELVLLGGDDIESTLSAADTALAIANPATAPYGAAAAAVLERPPFSAVSQRRLLRGSNVLQAYQYFASGAVDAALVARSLSPDAGIPIPGDWHPPIEQFALVSARSSRAERAQAFLDFLRGDHAAAMLPARGYQPCS